MPSSSLLMTCLLPLSLTVSHIFNPAAGHPYSACSPPPYAPQPLVAPVSSSPYLPVMKLSEERPACMHTAPHTSGYNVVPAMVAHPAPTTAAAFDGACVSSTGVSLVNSHVSELEVSRRKGRGARVVTFVCFSGTFQPGFPPIMSPEVPCGSQ